jgi:hypothetical protein
MSIKALSWLSVAFGASFGAMLGFHDARPAAVHRMPVASKTLPARIAVQPARVAPVFVDAHPMLPAVATPSEPAGAATPPEVAPVAEPAKERRAQPPKRKAQLLRTPPPAPASMARFPDATREPELRDPRAVFRAESACARNDPEQCLRAARAFRVGVATKPNPRSASIYWHSAQRIYEERCKQREVLSCIGLAAMYEKGPGTQPTYAPDLVEHARGICTHRFQEHCDELEAERQRLRDLLQGLDKPEGAETP